MIELNKNLFKSNKFLPENKQIISLAIYKCNNLFILKKNLFGSNKYLFGQIYFV